MLGGGIGEILLVVEMVGYWCMDFCCFYVVVFYGFDVCIFF